MLFRLVPSVGLAVWLFQQVPSTSAFQPAGLNTGALGKRSRVASRQQEQFSTSLSSSSSSAKDTASTTTTTAPKKPKTKKTLGLLTFDLDDTLYPVAPVLKEANMAFARAMAQYGFEGIQHTDIVKTSKEIREEISAQDPAKAAALTHTEILRLAIRRKMEKVILERKLQAAADDWATPVSSLSNIVVSHAKKWAKEAVSPSIVQAVFNAWEMERHHSAERRLYPECLDVFRQIKQEHPGVIIGAVTDGKANPLFMTFTLAPFFDFCISWEDDQAGRTKFFKELSSADSTAELKWIYTAALEKYQELSSADAALKKDHSDNQDSNKIWIHVGDDLAYDVGGSAECGAKTILVELDDKYGQTARLRFVDNNKGDAGDTSWSVAPDEEIEARKIMNEAAKPAVNAKIAFLTRLPEAINDILLQEGGEE